MTRIATGWALFFFYAPIFVHGCISILHRCITKPDNAPILYPRLQNAPTDAPTAHSCTYGRTHDAPICTYGAHRINSAILRNEKYKGDALLQKKFTVDFLTKKMKVNEGEVPQFYVEGSHPAIVDPAEWELVQQELARRKSNPRQRFWNNGFGGKIVCGECGAAFGPKVWHSTDAYLRTVWQCNRKYQPRPTAHQTEEKGSSPEGGEKKRPCATPHLTEEQIKAAFCKALNILLTDQDQLLADGKDVIRALTDCTSLEKKEAAIDAELAGVAARIEQLVKENALAALDQEKYSKRYSDLAGEYEALQRKRESVEKEKKARAEKRETLETFNRELEQLEVAFTPQRWNAIVEKVVVGVNGEMKFLFVNGGEVVV